MKKTIVILLVAVSVLGLMVSPSFAWHWRGGVFVGVGPYWGYPYPYYYPPPYYVYPPPTVVVEQPPVYVEQPPPAPAAPPAPPAPGAAQAYWYYCQSAKAYYPSVPSCSEEWVKVPERPR